MPSTFDDFAWFYDRYWAAPFAEWQRPAIERLLLPSVPAGGRILDVCCGSGTLARDLASRGYAIVGLDRSHNMLRIARRNVPEGLFFQADVAQFQLNPVADAAVSAFDSLNNVLHPEQLLEAFACIRRALRPGAYLVFDVNTGAAYGERWDQSFCEVQPDHAFFLRGSFDREARLGRTEITTFRLAREWERSDVEIQQRPWEAQEVESMLRDAGFDDISAFRSHEDLNMAGHYGIGRVYFRARSAGSI